jgi:hypothetical protein
VTLRNVERYIALKPEAEGTNVQRDWSYPKGVLELPQRS